jgi:outer membrane protein OmpA-like peptidoglycan-associated protein
MNPVNWWHSLEGGKIAEQRPPPPGADAPYPNLATVPAKPTPPDAEAMKKLTAALIADRANARYAAEAAPLPDPSSASASPGLFGIGAVPPPPPPARPPGQPAASASFQAVSAPPAQPASAAATASATPPPAKAPVKSVQSAPLAAAPSPVTTAAAPEAAPPLMPAQPPAPAAVTGAPPPPVAPLAPSPMPAPTGGASTHLEFVRGSAAVSPATETAVKQFAATRGAATILVTGYGDAEAGDPTAQTVALSLALSRAQAVANALGKDGVPAGSVRVAAEASGRGVALRLLH